MGYYVRELTNRKIVAAILISFVSWLSEKKIGLAGFLTALPLKTLLFFYEVM